MIYKDDDDAIVKANKRARIRSGTSHWNVFCRLPRVQVAPRYKPPASSMAAPKSRLPGTGNQLGQRFLRVAVAAVAYVKTTAIELA
ncbi:hypothetical protein [Bradyrhizobium sp. B120]|uniref:hypothetical protein n=1 Tax=Bradyrhizobium sp. B120 TaxID=3410088 RepID=UPI003B987245